MDHRTINELVAHNIISASARSYALDLLYPAKNWGLWLSRIFMTIGFSLILSGVVCFFAFNWTKLTPIIKLGSLETAIALCVIGALFYGLEKQAGKILLLGASVILGVFLAVFGQIYQTGADAYTLFLSWSLLILPWAMISTFIPIWAVFIFTLNIALQLYWVQVKNFPSTEINILFSTMLINGSFLFIKEFAESKGIPWLQQRWINIVLMILTLYPGTIATILFIFSWTQASVLLIISTTILTFLVHIIFYYYYRFMLFNRWTLSAVILSICLIGSVTGLKITNEFLGPVSGKNLIYGSIILGIFSLGIRHLRQILNAGEKHHV